MKSKKKSILGILLSLALMLTMMSALGLSQKAYAADVTYYDLWVGGVQVTSANAADVLKDGTISFTPETTNGESTIPATLTLKGADISGENGNYTKDEDDPDECGTIRTKLNNLTIDVKSDSIVTGPAAGE